MTGCRHNAKNTLDKNYLHLAEKNGAQVHPLTTVIMVRPLAGGGFAFDAVRTGRTGRRRRNRRTFTAGQVVVAPWRPVRLCSMAASQARPTRGTLTGTNSEAILGAKARSANAGYTRGVAITSSFHPDEYTYIEPVRYGKGSNAKGLLQTALTDGGKRWPRWVTWLAAMLNHPRNLAWLYVRRWSERTIILLVMQSLDNSITVSGKTGRFGRYRLISGPGHGAANPTGIPAGNEAARRVADKIDGLPGGTIGEVANIPMTAHFIGGCAIGEAPTPGVVDPYQRVFGHPDLHIVDGSTISANLGVNPSLTITAQADRAMSRWPNNGEADPRPPLGTGYRRLDPVRPIRLAVPPQAPAGLRLPLQVVRRADDEC